MQIGYRLSRPLRLTSRVRSSPAHPPRASDCAGPLTRVVDCQRLCQAAPDHPNVLHEPMYDFYRRLRNDLGYSVVGRGIAGSPSGSGELHPEALTERYVAVSRHTARATPEGCRLPSTTLRSSGLLLAQDPDAGDPLPSLSRRYPASRPLRRSPPEPPRRYFPPRIVPLAPFPLSSASWFLRFRVEACVQVAPPVRWPPSTQYCGHPMDLSQE